MDQEMKSHLYDIEHIMGKCDKCKQPYHTRIYYQICVLFGSISSTIELQVQLEKGQETCGSYNFLSYIINFWWKLQCTIFKLVHEAPCKSKGGDVVVYGYPNHIMFPLKFSLPFLPHYTGISTSPPPPQCPCNLSTTCPPGATHGHYPSPRHHPRPLFVPAGTTDLAPSRWSLYPPHQLHHLSNSQLSLPSKPSSLVVVVVRRTNRGLMLVHLAFPTSCSGLPP